VERDKMENDMQMELPDWAWEFHGDCILKHLGNNLHRLVVADARVVSLGYFDTLII
jgi:hypothetical protein